jgi:virginiamycin B lyase
MIGRLDPKTGQIKLATLPSPRSNPYGLVINSKGVPFFCEFGANRLASIDPTTMAIQEYPLPHADSRPRRIAITPDDVIWYTTMHGVISAASIPRLARSKNIPRPAGRIRNLMASRSQKERFGTASPECDRIRS